jgi:hypothetical protein
MFFKVLGHNVVVGQDVVLAISRFFCYAVGIVEIKFLIDDEKALKTLAKGRSVRLKSLSKHLCPVCDKFTKRAAWIYLEEKTYRIEYRCKCGHIDSETFPAVFKSNYAYDLPTLTTKQYVLLRKTKKYATGLFDNLLKTKKPM